MKRTFHRSHTRLTALLSLVVSPLLVLSFVTSAKANLQRQPHLSNASVFQPTALPSGLQLTALDSSIRATWTPSNDPQTAWQVFSVWDGGALVGTKILAATVNAADQNGLQTGHAYVVRVQAMDQAGALSAPVQATATTDPQPPMANARFFENFNHSHGNDLDPDYFDVRSVTGVSQPESLNDEIDKRLVFGGERHFHTQLIASQGQMGLMIRPRVPFDIANGRTGTFQFEVDLAPGQRIEGKWFEAHLVGENNIPGTTDHFGTNTGDEFPNSIEFSVRDNNDNAGAAGLNLPTITVNTGGAIQRFTGDGSIRQTSQLTPVNVRVPVVLQVSQTSAAMYINGTRVMAASGFTLPFTKGYWILAHKSFYSARYHQNNPRPPTMALQLMHWDTIQFDGPQGSYSPVVRTYVQAGCSGVVYNIHNGIRGCPRVVLDSSRSSQSFNFGVADSAKARSARLLFNGGTGRSLTININGRSTSITAKNGGFEELNTVDVPASWLRDATTVTIANTSGATAYLTQVELEVVYDTPRAMHPSPPVDFAMPMLALTSNNFRIDHTNGVDPAIHTFSTYVYHSGSAGPAPYAATIVTPDTPWLRITSGASGTVSAVAKGGALAQGRIDFQVDFSGVPVEDNRGDGSVGVVKISGGSMPVYLAVVAVNGGNTPHPVFISSFPLMTTFAKCAIPGYCPGSQPAPGVTPRAFAPLIAAGGR